MPFVRAHGTVATGTNDATKQVSKDAWNEGHAVSGATSGGIPYFSSATGEGTSALLAANQLMAGGGVGLPPTTINAIIAGPTAPRTYTFPDADATVLYAGGALGTPASGVATNLTGTAAGLTAGAASAVAIGGITGLGTGVATALAVSVGSAGAPVVFGGALGTPSSGTGTNLTGIPYSALAAGTAGNLITWDAAGAAAVVATGTATHVLTSNGVGAAPTFQAPAAGGATLNGITAATADQAGIANADWNVVWNWRKTTDSEVGFTFGESAASTGGTQQGGFPTGVANQAIVRFSTLAASTASPFQVYARGAHVMSVPYQGNQVLFSDGSLGSPAISPASKPSSGIYFIANNYAPRFVVDGTLAFSTGDAQGGHINVVGGTNFAAPGIRVYVNSSNYSGIAINDTGSADGMVGISISTVENSRWVANVYQMSKGSADAVSYAMNFRKSRGSVLSPTAITTADDLATISAYGYVGATNTYREATRIRYDSIGTVSDATTGVGGEIVLGTMKQGVDTAAVDRFKVDQFGHLVSLIGTANTPTITADGGTNPTILGTDSAFVVTIGTGGTATSVTVTFGTAYVTNPPVVTCDSDTDIVPFKVVPAVGSVTISATLAFTAGSKLYCSALAML